MIWIQKIRQPQIRSNFNKTLITEHLKLSKPRKVIILYNRLVVRAVQPLPRSTSRIEDDSSSPADIDTNN